MGASVNHWLAGTWREAETASQVRDINGQLLQVGDTVNLPASIVTIYSTGFNKGSLLLQANMMLFSVDSLSVQKI